MTESRPTLGARELEARSAIGRRIVYWAIAAVTLLGAVAIWPGGSDAKDVLSMLLPVLGAWVGTVLAFYFSRENYVAATENNAALLERTLSQRLQSISASKAMLPMSQVQALRTDDPEGSILLVSRVLDSGPIKAGRNRVPILGTSGVMRYIIHRSMVDKFIADKARVQGTDVAALTLKDLVESGDYRDLITSFGCVQPDQSLSAVKAKMDTDHMCQDVVVTEDGTRNKPALGWITNVMVLEHSRADS